MSKRRSASVVTKAADAFKERWLIQANNLPYFNRAKDYAAIKPLSSRPRDQVENTIRSYPELEFNTNFYKRHTIVRAPKESEVQQLGPQGQVEPLGVDKDNMWDQPYHLPVPEWTNDQAALARMAHQALYWGYMTSGSQWRPTAEDIVVLGMDNDFEYFHD